MLRRSLSICSALFLPCGVCGDGVGGEEGEEKGSSGLGLSGPRICSGFLKGVKLLCNDVDSVVGGTFPPYLNLFASRG